jgi:RNA polymerase sigma factor (sigma-70 family)
MSFVTSIADSVVGRAFIEHGQDLFRFLSKRRRSASQDYRLAQETYARLVRMPAEDLARDPQSYLFRVASNLLHEFELDGRAESVTRRLWKTEVLGAASGEPSDCAVDNALRGVRVREILKELTPLSRAALILHRRDGMSYEQIADQVGVSPLRVRQAFAQGLQHFCRRLQDYR